MSAMKCRYCKENAEPDRTLCLRHLIARRDASKRHRKKMLDAGRCVSCGKTPLVTRIYCKLCKILNQKVQDPNPCSICKIMGHVRKDHKVLGICWYCPLPVTDSNLCKTHHEERAVKNRLKAKLLRQKWQRLGKCLVCGKKAVTKTRCQKHRKYAADWERTHRIR